MFLGDGGGGFVRSIVQTDLLVLVLLEKHLP